jgi:hypothetical protein
MILYQTHTNKTKQGKKYIQNQQKTQGKKIHSQTPKGQFELCCVFHSETVRRNIFWLVGWLVAVGGGW